MGSLRQVNYTVQLLIWSINVPKIRFLSVGLKGSSSTPSRYWQDSWMWVHTYMYCTNSWFDYPYSTQENTYLAPNYIQTRIGFRDKKNKLSSITGSLKRSRSSYSIQQSKVKFAHPWMGRVDFSNILFVGVI